ncbi:MAG: hypothetical protein R3F35_00700 [Myxococcota bacterium]
MKSEPMRARPTDGPSILPAEPVAPQTFVEDVIPALFAELELPPQAREVEFRLGLVLEGPGGGEWTLHFIEGELGIEPTRDPRCDLTLIQRVDDWRAALWAGRPGFVADAVGALFGGAGERSERLARAAESTVDPAVVEALRSLRGRVELRVEPAADGSAPGAGATDAAGTGDAEIHGRPGRAERDWWLAVQLGPGPIAVMADAAVALGAEQADAIQRGGLHPLEALITGELRLEGDLGLILQLQALALRFRLPAAVSRAR